MNMNGYSIVSELVLEKAVSKAQQRLFAMVHADQMGHLKHPSKVVKSIAKSMSPKEVTKFAKTKTKNLPEKK